ncbi:uncharacterized protein DUF3152 [Sanguibacter antarcticus]|uniref:Uncharacterized protein DUF3152 n=2 Tax=Sanguibacter antarcticus TaxID=372484 RepID=A0A2A9E5M8_9MICO|nr:uncharacterized protein DUF3152 [Sanguibacter antarcticus]
MRAQPVVTLTLLGILTGVGAGASTSDDGITGLAALVRDNAADTVDRVSAAPGETPVVRAASRGHAREALESEVAPTPSPVVEPAEVVEPDAEALAAAQAQIDADAEALEVEAAQSAALAAAEALPDGVSESDFMAGILSASSTYEGDGTFLVVPGEVAAPGAGEVTTIRIQVENGLEVDAQKFADLVLATLNDSRSWGGDGSQTFARTESADATLTVSLASPDMVDELCAPLDTEGLWSCGVEGHAVLNAMRWYEGSGIYDVDRVSYRQYLINHEVGHVLGYKHVLCTGSNNLADVMVQQSGASLSCIPNGWPFP